MHTPQLKLDDEDDRFTVIPPKPLRIEEHPELGYYPMTATKHGIALIINNWHFSDARYAERRGSKRDEYNLIQTFLYLGYRPVVCTDLTKQEMTYLFSHLDQFLEDSNNKAKMKVANDSFVCCILSHGEQGAIIASNSQPVLYGDLETMIGKSVTLKSKPKMLFVQADSGGGGGKDGRTDSSSPRTDFYTCFASAPGGRSYRDIYTGSWFITEMCKILCEYATYDSLNSEFQLRLNRNVATNPTYRYHRNETIYVQQPSCSNQLQQYVHFFYSK